jgi:uncharacterized protein (DUF2267 family)
MGSASVTWAGGYCCRGWRVSRWFRFYADAMRNPKVARLNDLQFRLWVELLAVASENDGLIPGLDDLKHILKRRLDHLSRAVKDLISTGLIDVLDDGYEPHSWAKYQYKSDVSTDRVVKHRAKRNVSETPPETDTDTDTEVIVAKATITARAKATGKGSRITLEWMPSQLPPDVAALADQWPDERRERTLAEFRDYWLSRSRDAAKNNWDRVWHNRIRDMHDRIMRDSRNDRSNPNNRTIDRRDGVAKALDRRLGPDEPAPSPGRFDPSDGSSYRISSPASLAIVPRSSF